MLIRIRDLDLFDTESGMEKFLPYLTVRYWPSFIIIQMLVFFIF